MIELKKKGRKPSNQKAFDRIMAIKPGKSITMKREDWFLAMAPGAHIIRKYTGKETRVQSFADDSGWKITAI